MKKAHLTKNLAFLILITLFLIGCTVQRSGKVVTEEDVRKGTESLSMSFMNNLPPAKVFSAEKDFSDSGIFEVGLNLENKGASDIVSGIITLSLESGYVNDFGGKWKSSDERFNERNSGNSVTFQLAGKSAGNAAGDKMTFSKVLQAKIPEADKESQSRKSTIIATACYDYKTKKTTSVCIEPRPLSQQIGKKPCEPKDVTLDSQGAPLAITKISPRTISTSGASTVEFLIYIKNKGSGQIIPSDSILAACESTGGAKDFWNTINQGDFKIELSTGETNFKCGPFPMKLSQGQEDYIRCVYDGILPGTQAYATSLNLEFDYGYTLSSSKEITIERPPQIKSQ